MKIEFEGTMDEFRNLFGQVGSSVPAPVVFAAEPKPDPEPTPLPSATSDLPHIPKEQREAAWAEFKSVCASWVEGFEEEGAAQPDRLALLTHLGAGPWPLPILVMAYERGSLQALVLDALYGEDAEDLRTPDGLDYVNRVAANMVQVSHMAFPDLAGTYDHSTKWRK